MADILNLFGGSPFVAPPVSDLPRSSYDAPEIQLLEAIERSGINAPESVIMDGRLHRFSSSGQRGDTAGWYVLYPGQIPAGAFGCWRDQLQVNFRADVDRDLSADELEEISRLQREARAQREAETALRHASVAMAAEEIWCNGLLASPDMPYLQRKQIQPHGAKVTSDGRLMLPMWDASGKLSSLQYIAADGEKRYQSGGSVEGCTHLLGSLQGATTLYIAEGFATAASIAQHSLCPVVVAYTAGNLMAAAKQWRDRVGAAFDLCIVADNDASGTGQKCASEAASAVGARIVMPPIIGMDANDYACSGNDLAALLTKPTCNDFLVAADDFCQQPAPLKWWVKGWIQQEALIMIHGPSGGGKTFAVLDMVLRCASGELSEWMGNKVRHCPVVYLAGEGHHGLRGRIAAWKNRHQVSKLNMFLSKEGCDLNTPIGYYRVADALRALPAHPGIVVVDTLHRFLDGDENSAQDTKTMLDACGKLINDFGCCVILVHHTGVSDEAQHRARGSSAWRGALDIEISVVPQKDDAPMEIAQRKSKDAELAASKFAWIDPEQIPGWFDEDGEPVGSAVLIQADEVKKVDTKLAEFKSDIKKAWFATNTEVVGGKPYISKAGLKRFFVNNKGMTESSAAKYVSPSTEGKPIHSLLVAGVISDATNGYIVIEPELISAMFLERSF